MPSKKQQKEKYMANCEKCPVSDGCKARKRYEVNTWDGYKQHEVSYHCPLMEVIHDKY